MQSVQIEPFKIIGIAKRTSNVDEKAAQDIGALWSTFMTEGIQAKIPNKMNQDIYSLYTEYEGDHMKPYTVILGCKVETLDEIPEGMVGKSFDGGVYSKMVTKGDLTQNIVYDAWLNIWQMDLDRAYQVDFEIYGAKAQNPADAEVEIFIGLN